MKSGTGPDVRVSRVMSDNIFTNVYDDPFVSSEEWFPLLADNTNAPLGVELPSFAAYRRVRVAAFFFIIQKTRGPARQRVEQTPLPAMTLVGRGQDWFLSDPA